MDYTEIVYYMSLLDKEWGAAGRKVVSLIWNLEDAHLNMPYSEFLNLCTACGGNWGGMLLSDAIPNDMGHNAWNCICATLALMGVTF